MDEKLDGFGARLLEDLLVALSLELNGSSEPVVVLSLPHLLGSSSEDDGSTSFLEEKAADEAEGTVDDELHPYIMRRKEISSTRLGGFTGFDEFSKGTHIESNAIPSQRE